MLKLDMMCKNFIVKNHFIRKQETGTKGCIEGVGETLAPFNPTTKISGVAHWVVSSF